MDVGIRAVDFLKLLYRVVAAACVEAAFVVAQHELFGREHVQFVGHLLHTHVGIETYVDFAVVLRTALGGDDHNAVGTAGTVDGRRRSILQDVDAFNLGGVEGRHAVFAGETVDDVQRLVALRDGDTATYADGDFSTRSTFALHHLHTGYAAGQGLRHIRGRSLQQLIALDRYDRTGQVFAARRTVTDGYDFFQLNSIVVENHVDLFLTGNFDFLRLHTYIGKDEDVLGCVVYFDRVLAVEVGDGSDTLGSFQHDVGTDYFHAIRVSHFTRYRHALRLDVQAGQ